MQISLRGTTFLLINVKESADGLGHGLASVAHDLCKTGSGCRLVGRQRWSRCIWDPNERFLRLYDLSERRRTGQSDHVTALLG